MSGDMMPTQFDDAIRTMCTNAVRDAVHALAIAYSFDVEDALAMLNLDNLKVVRKRGPTVAVPRWRPHQSWHKRPSKWSRWPSPEKINPGQYGSNVNAGRYYWWLAC